MHYNFCTLFDSYYLTRGLALYDSLSSNIVDFTLYIFAFDDRCFNILKELNLENASIIQLHEFEDEKLLSVKPHRTVAEYCWTSTASTIFFCIKKYNLDHCTYLDADIYFFCSPEKIFEELGESSIGITPHRFSTRFKSSEVLGKYCVQFVYFRNDKNGMEALIWWRDKCLEWCFAKMEENRYGDQKYLDYFPSLFKGVKVIENLGAGLAPWNIKNYLYKLIDETLYIIQHDDIQNAKQLIFYHYQGLGFSRQNDKIIVYPSLIKIPKLLLNKIYLIYIEKILSIENIVKKSNNENFKIVFKYNIYKDIRSMFNGLFKKYIIIRYIFFKIKKNRYSRPHNIGSEV